MDKVKVVNTVNHEVYVNVPELRFTRTWPTAGSTVMIDRNTLEELMNDIGFHNMLTMGILYIDDMKVKQELGLEPDDATEPENIIILSDKDKRYYMTTLSLVGFKDKISKLGRTQIDQLCDFAIENRILDMDKCKVLKEVCGRDILKAITLDEQDKEA